MPKPKLKLPNRTPTLLLSPTIAFRSVTSKTGKGVYASSDTLFKGAVFGRDSLEVADDIMLLKPRVVRNILLTLASLQGLHSSDITEEEHGKIVHEYRSIIVDGKPIDDTSKMIFDELAAKWGGNDEEMVYYASIDSTPHYVRVLCTYAKQNGKDIFKERVIQRDGQATSLLAVMTSCVDWIMDKLASSSTGLLEYRRRNPHSIENQVWKDSKEFYVHENGELANHSQPIASIEVQGLAYDALMMAAEFLPERADGLMQRAFMLRDTTVERLWQADRQYFALGIDHAPSGKIRIIQTMTANPAALLDSTFFDLMDVRDKRAYIQGIVTRVMGHDFITDAGIRSRALHESQLIDFWDYHGSFTTWPKETYDIAKGLRRQGFPKLAQELENRLINLVRRTKSYPEFVYVDENGRVLTAASGSSQHGEFMLVDGINKPESIQAWTVSAILAIVAQRLPNRTTFSYHERRQQWHAGLESKIMAAIPRVSRLWSTRQLKARYPDYPYRLARGSSQGRQSD
jgi:glycogen debranching enzyme